MGLGGLPGSAIDAIEWTETLAGEPALDACETPSEHLQEAVPEMHGKGGRMRAAPPERDPRWSGQHCFKEFGKQRCGWHRQAASSGRVRVAPPGGDTWTSADSPIEAGPSYRSCTASPQRRRGVTVPSLIETICEL